jgi:ABC-2 type transport system permease protein
MGAAYTIGVRYATGITALSFSLRSHAQFFAITTFAGLPLTFASTALVPVALMPGWMRDIARVNPLTLATGELRSLITAGWHPMSLAGTAGVLFAFGACCVALATSTLRRGLASH